MLNVPSGPLTLTIENIGVGDAELGTLTLQGRDPGDYAIDTDTCSGQTLMPGNDCNVGISFTATESGLRRARLRVPSNTPDSPQFVELIGSHDVLFADDFED